MWVENVVKCETSYISKESLVKTLNVYNLLVSYHGMSNSLLEITGYWITTDILKSKLFNVVVWFLIKCVCDATLDILLLGPCLL